MLDKLFSLFGCNAIHKITVVTSNVANLISIFEQEFATDKDAKNAAIDTLIALLEKHKDVPAVTPEVPSTTPSA